MIAAYGGVDLKDKLLTFEEWGKLKSEKIPYLPYIEQPDGKIKLETVELCKHLATLGGKMTVDEKQTELCKTANSHPMQTADPYLNLPEEAWPNYKLPSLEDWVKQLAPVLKKLAGDLGDGPFFGGETPGYGEAFIWHNIENQMIGPASAQIKEAVGAEDMKKLMAFHAKFKELPGVKEYLAGRPKKFGAPGSFASKLGSEEKSSKNAGTLVYFMGLQSRGEPCRMIAAYGGVDLKDKLLTFEEWGKLKSEKIPYLPYIEQPDGKIKLETVELCKHLATLGGKMTVDEKQTELCKTANSHPMQTADPYLNLPEEAWPNYKLPSLEDWVKQLAPVLKKLAGDLGDGPFFGGETPGYGEAFIWHNIENQMIGPASAQIKEAVGAEDMKKLMAFHAKFKELPGVKEYLAGRPKKFGAPGSFASKL